MVVLDMCHGNTTVLLQSAMVLLILFVTVVITGECDRFSVKNVWLCKWTAAGEGFSKK